MNSSSMQEKEALHRKGLYMGVSLGGMCIKRALKPLFSVVQSLNLHARLQLQVGA